MVGMAVRGDVPLQIANTAPVHQTEQATSIVAPRVDAIRWGAAGSYLRGALSTGVTSFFEDPGASD